MSDTKGLKADKDGFYTVVLDHLGRPRLDGRAVAPLTLAQIDEFTARVKRNLVFGEMGQEFGQGQLSERAFTERVQSMRWSRAAFRIVDVSFLVIDDEASSTGLSQRVVAKLMPMGPFADAFVQLAAEGKLYFGIRAFTGKEVYGGMPRIQQMICWDLVSPPPAAKRPWYIEATERAQAQVAATPE